MKSGLFYLDVFCIFTFVLLQKCSFCQSMSKWPPSRNLTLNQCVYTIPSAVINPVFDTYSHQKFSLPSFIIYYLVKSSNSLKLYSCCKFFPSKYPIVSVEALEWRSCDLEPYWIVHSPFLRDPLYTFDSEAFKHKLCITQKLQVYSFQDGERNVVSTLCKKIFRCSLKQLSFDSQDISYDEFLMLTESKQLISVYMENVSVKDKKGNFVEEEKIFTRFRNLAFFF